MAQNRLSGPGLGLPYPQQLYPISLVGASPTPAQNVISLAYGQALPIPGGDWVIAGAPMQWLDPVSTQWLFAGGSSYATGEVSVSEGYVHSDGQNFRIINPQGIATGAAVTAAGSGYAAATTTVSSNNSSTWTPVVGGSLSLTLVTGGSGYTLPPIVLIPAPPSPGVQATATATISSAGVVTGFTLQNSGAGYGATAPAVLLLPSPYDPNYANIVNATATATVGGSGTITAVLCTNSGAPTPQLVTTAASGTGSVATLTFATAVAPVVGSTIIVSGVTPTGYNGTYTVTASSTTSVSYANTTTASQTIAGTVNQVPVLTISGAGTGATASAANFFAIETAPLTVYLQPL